MTDTHAHHAMHLVVARHGPIIVRSESGAGVAAARGVLTAPDVPHALDARGADVVLVFIDPESGAGARMAGAMTDSVALLSDDQVDHLWAIMGPDASFEALTRWAPRALEYLAPHGRARRIHPRVRATLRHLEQLPPGKEPALQELAELAGLSGSRFTHAFAESVGVPLRTYLLWRKLQHAVIGIASGRALAQTARDAGFADAAHMTRTFRRMFGTTPSELRRQSDALASANAQAASTA
jgi:AraC-like DNA-binding protein